MIIEALAAAAALLGGGEAASACRQPVGAASRSADTLTITPSRCGRQLAQTHPGAVLRAAGAVPSLTLRDQLRCHAYFASFKSEWNLEAARPVVDWPRLVLSACNPS